MIERLTYRKLPRFELVWGQSYLDSVAEQLTLGHLRHWKLVILICNFEKQISLHSSRSMAIAGTFDRVVVVGGKHLDEAEKMPAWRHMKGCPTSA